MEFLYWVQFGLILCLLTKPVQSVNQELIDLPINSTWNQTAITVAGDDSPASDNSHLNQPRSIDIYSNNSILISDTGNNRIIRFDQRVLNGTVVLNSSVVCDGISGNLRDIFIAIDDSIYISCTNPFIERWLPDGNKSIVVGTGAQSSELNQPQGIFVDSSFNLYVADSGNRRVMKWTLNSSQGQVMINTSTVPNLQNPYELFLDETSMILYISDSTGSGLLIQLFLANGSISLFAGTFVSPKAMIVDKNNRVYLIESDRHRVLRLEPNGSNYTCIAACSGSSGVTASQLNQPSDLRFDQYGNLLVSDTNNDRIQKFLLTSYLTSSTESPLIISPCAQWSVNATTILGDPNGNIGSTLTRLYYPRGLAIDKSNQVYVADCGNHRILRITSAGSIESIATNQLQHPTDMVFDQDEQLYVLESAYQRVLLFPANSVNSTSNVTVAWGHGSGGATDQLAWYQGYTSAGLAIDINLSALYVSDMENQRVSMWILNATNGIIVDGVTGVAYDDINHLSFPQGIILDEKGRLWIADFGNNRVVTWSNGSSPMIQVADVFGVAGLAFDSTGTLYIVEGNQHQVSRWRADWNRTECILACNNGLPGTRANQLSSPERIQIDYFGNLIVSDTVNNRIQKFFLIDNSPCESTTIFSPSTNQPVTNGSQSTSDYQDMTTTVPSDLDVYIKSTLPSQTISVLSETTNPLNLEMITATPNDFFIPSINCSNNSIGNQCQYSMDPCIFDNPCKNNGTCRNNVQLGYTCECLLGYEGDQCQYDRTLCRIRCFGRGNCSNIDDGTDFKCLCEAGWTGKYCEQLIDNCVNVTCENKGICGNVLLDYICFCSQTYFSGRHCETSSMQMKILVVVSASIGYIGWTSIGVLMGFVFIMDVLKYILGIDPVESERQRLKRAKMKKQRSSFTSNKSKKKKKPKIRDQKTTIQTYTL